MSYTDRTLKCRDCGVDFVFTAGEQEFYESRGLQNAPGRCPECRAARRGQSRSEGSSYGGGYSRAPREMHPAVCSECGTQTQVPFLPRTDRPIYCSDCFEKVRRNR